MNLLFKLDRALRNVLFISKSWAQGYCSQFGQDKWVIEEMLRGRRNGFFLDLGASDGWLCSNTYVLERRYGWRGICIEANDTLFEKLQKKRHCTTVHACIADRERDVDFIENLGTWGGMPEVYPQGYLTPLHQLFKKEVFMDEAGRFKTIKKHAYPLATILEQHHAPRVIDYASIDTECSEYLILKDFPFDRYTFLTATVEHGNQPEPRRLLRELFLRHGYILHHEGSCDFFWYHPLLLEQTRTL